MINHTSKITATLYKIQDSNNLGLIYRTAECFGIKTVFGYKCSHPNYRVTRGSHQWIKRVHIGSIKTHIQTQHKNGVNVICAKISNKATPLPCFNFSYPCTIMVGNESLGIPNNISNLCDSIVEIPMHGKTPCLNVAIAFAVLCNESITQFYRQPNHTPNKLTIHTPN